MFSRVKNFGFCVMSTVLPTWPWTLMIPGITNLPVRSITSAPAGGLMFAAEPIRVIRPFSITMPTSAMAALPVPSMSVKFFRTLTSAKAESDRMPAKGKRNFRMLVCSQICFENRRQPHARFHQLLLDYFGSILFIERRQIRNQRRWLLIVAEILIRNSRVCIFLSQLVGFPGDLVR